MEFSVIIPTYNRAAVLKKTLRALAVQTAAAPATVPAYEVVVVDDGSVDSSAQVVRSLTPNYPAPLHYFYQSNQRQGTARNLGAARARGRTLIFLGDDTVPQPHFVFEHARARRRLSRQDVVIGYTPWPPDYPKTRFMDYVGEQGWQFGFSLIDDPQDVPFNFFYTSNLSIDRGFFVDSGGFDPDFCDYGWEDVELSWRLKQAGMVLVYHPRAVAHHYHPTSIRSFVQRQRRVGKTAWTFYRKHPQLAQFLHVDRVARYPVRQHLKMLLLTQLCCWTERKPWPDLSRHYPDLMSYYYNLGLLEGRDGAT